MAIVSSYYEGMDYHLDAIRVCVLDQDGYECVNRSVPNEVAAVMELVDRYGEPEVVTLEACCGTSHFAEELHERTGWNLRLADAGDEAGRGPDRSGRGFLIGRAGTCRSSAGGLIARRQDAPVEEIGPLSSATGQGAT